MSEISKLIQKLMNERNINQVELAKLTGIRQSSISDYVNGKYEPKQDKIELISKALGVSPSMFFYYIEDPKEKRIPLIGRIAAGAPITSLENVEDWFKLDNHLDADFVLVIKGDSMNGACIYDGDYAFFKQCKTLENGQIGAVYVDGDKTVKRFYKTGDTVTLQAENPNYAPIVLTSGDVWILGRLVACLRFF